MRLKATTWNYCWPDDPQPGLLHLEPPALSKKSSFSIQCFGGTSEEQYEIARRIAALWNAAERVDLSTEDIKNGKIERALECIEKLEALIAAAPEMLGKIKRLEAEKAELLAALEMVSSKLYYCNWDYYWY